MQVSARFLQIFLLILYPLSTHVAIYLQKPIIALIPLLLLIASHAQLTKIFIYPVRHGIILLTFITVIAISITRSIFALLYLPPIIISFMMLILFAKTLLPGQEPLITTLARVIYHDNRLSVQIYTRHVTEMWCLFFIAMLLEVTLLSIFADAKTWSLFCNILNYIFIAIVFLTEYIYRHFKFKNNDSLSLLFKQMIKTDIKQLLQREKPVKIPLIAHKNPDTLFAFHQKKSIRSVDFLKDVYNVMQQLSKELYVINLCEDRYYFTVLFAAALLQKKITLLPNNKTPHIITGLQREFHDHLILRDCDINAYLQHIKHYSLETYTIPDIESTQLVVILYTSGSTGTPIPWKKHWGELVHHCVQTAESLMLKKNENICIVATVVPQHMYGLEHSVILPMQMGFAMCAAKPFFVEDIRNALQWDNYETVLFSTPLQLKQCVDTDIQFPSLRLLVSSTARLSTSLAIRCENEFCTSLYELYGCTEAGCIATRRTAQTETWTLNTNYRLHFENNACFLILKNRHKIRLSDDIEQIDKEHFILRGRLQDNINIAGNRMSLSDLNIKLNSIAGVKDGIFYLLAPESMTPRLIAFVVTDNLSPEHIKHALREMLNPIFLPRIITIIDKLPRNELGKIEAIAMQRLVARIGRI